MISFFKNLYNYYEKMIFELEYTDSNSDVNTDSDTEQDNISEIDCEIKLKTDTKYVDEPESTPHKSYDLNVEVDMNTINEDHLCTPIHKHINNTTDDNINILRQRYVTFEDKVDDINDIL